MSKLQLFVLICAISCIAICNNCAIITGTQFDDLDCDWQVGIVCEDGVFYKCLINPFQKKDYLFECGQIDNLLAEYYDIDISLYLECCE